MERCSSSTSYMDYHHRHSLASNNFCYPYSPGMMRTGGGSPYPMGGGVGSGGAPRYGMADYRSGGYYGEGFDKYYGGGGGGFHSGYGANYYGNGYASYRDFGYNDYYQGSAFAGHHGSGYHGPAGASHLYGGRQSLPVAFQRESYYQHHPRDHPHSSPYGFGGNYSGNPYKADSGVASSSTPPNSGDAALFGGTPNGNSFQHSPDYPYGSSSGDSPEGSGSRGSGGGPGYPTSPSSSSAMPNATGFPLNIKDARMRKLKERKLAKSSSSSSYSPGGGGGGSTCSSPNPVGSSSGPGSGSGNNPGPPNGAGQRLKSLDALGPDTFEHHERPGKSSPSSRHPSPGRAAAGSGGGSPPKRSKKQTTAKHGRGNSAAATADNDKSGDPAATMATSPDKNVTPLPGFQQAFGSTEIGKFSEAFFNSSPGPTSSDMLGHQHPDGTGHHPHHHHQHHHQHHHPHPHHQLMMDSLAAATGCESDVDTLSPQPWEPTGPGDPFHEPGGSSTYNLQIGTSFHPSYYETTSSSSTAYTTTDHAVDSPLGNYFSEMTCTDQYVT